MKHFMAIGMAVLVYFVQGPSFVFHPWSRLPDWGDSFINSWILAWDAHSLFDPAAFCLECPHIFSRLKMPWLFLRPFLGIYG